MNQEKVAGVASVIAIAWSSHTLGQDYPPGYKVIPTDQTSAFNWDEPDRFRWILSSGRDLTERAISDEEAVVYRGNGWTCAISPTEAGRSTWAAQGERYFKEARLLVCTSTKSGNKVMIEVSCTTSKEAKMYTSAVKDLYLGAASTPVEFKSMFWMQLECKVWVDLPDSLDGKVQEYEWRSCTNPLTSCKIEEPKPKRR